MLNTGYIIPGNKSYETLDTLFQETSHIKHWTHFSRKRLPEHNFTGQETCTLDKLRFKRGNTS